MSLSTDYHQLLQRITHCSKELLPATSPTSSYSDGEVLRMYGFRLFAHAEVEGYVEFLAETLTTAMATKHQGSGLPNKLLRHLVLHQSMMDKYPPRGLSPVITPRDLSRTTNFLRQHIDVIEGNNGVTEKDILKLFAPLGIELSDFDALWLQSMTQLGVARGEVAHNSVLGLGTATQPSPSGERTLLVQPLWGLRRLTRSVDAILNLL